MGPGTHELTPTGQVLGSNQCWCLVHLICRPPVSTFTPVYTQDQLNLSKGTERLPLALSYGRKNKCKENIRWLSGQMQEAMSLVNVRTAGHTPPQDHPVNEPSNRQLSLRYISFPSTRPHSQEGWNSLAEAVQIYLALLTVLLFYSCQENLSQRHFLPKRFLRDTWQHSLREPEAGWRASDKDTREMTAPWWSANSWPLGLAPTTQKRCRAQRHTWTWWSRGHKVINKLNPALTPQAPRLQRAECSCSMENYLPGQRGFPTTEIQQGNGGSQLARPQIASVSHRDTESLRAGVTVGGEETLPGWPSAGHVHEDEGWKDFQ